MSPTSCRAALPCSGIIAYLEKLVKQKSLAELEIIGAAGGTRTLNPLRETDFESVAYTIPPPRPDSSTRENSNKLGRFRQPLALSKSLALAIVPPQSLTIIS